jgi:group I intron endonuclease
MPTGDSTTLARSGIYAIRHKATGRIYLGSAADIPRRWRCHRSRLRLGTHHSRYLQRAWNKYGPDAFVFEVLRAVPDPNGLIEVEQEYLDRLQPYRWRLGFNVCSTAGSPLGRQCRPETRAKMAEAMRGKKHSPEAKAKITAALTGKKLSPEHCAKMAEAARNCSPEARARMAAARRGKTHSPETRAKIAETLRRRRAADLAHSSPTSG